MKSKNIRYPGTSIQDQSILAIFLTGSRMGALIVGVTFIFLGFREFIVFRPSKKIIGILMTLVIMGTLYHLLVKNVKFRIPLKFSIERYENLFLYMKTYGEKNIDKSLELRKKHFFTAIEEFSDNPITGVGLGNFRQAKVELLGLDPELKVAKFVAHNAYFGLGAEIGIVGMLIFLLLIIFFY